ncbi:MAG: hypothetical protein JW929_00425 [Anaerolineales bacterium]|nr:hypothetical protein [Anaerolineales bacterium]
MTNNKAPVYRQVTFHPHEADRIAEDITRLIQTLTTEHSQLDTASINVCYDWLGHQKDVFFEETRPKVKKNGHFY